MIVFFCVCSFLLCLISLASHFCLPTSHFLCLPSSLPLPILHVILRQYNGNVYKLYRYLNTRMYPPSIRHCKHEWCLHSQFPKFTHYLIEIQQGFYCITYLVYHIISPCRTLRGGHSGSSPGANRDKTLLAGRTGSVAVCRTLVRCLDTTPPQGQAPTCLGPYQPPSLYITIHSPPPPHINPDSYMEIQPVYYYWGEHCYCHTP